MNPQPLDDQSAKAAFHLERLLEQLDGGYPAAAHRTFVTHHAMFRDVLEEELFEALQKRVFSAEPARDEAFALDFARLKDALEFCEYAFVHDQCSEFLLRHSHESGRTTEKAIQKAEELLAASRMHYLEPDEVRINTAINGRIEFVVSERKIKTSSTESMPRSILDVNRQQGGHRDSIPGDPGFTIADTSGRLYRCFVKKVSAATVGDVIHLKITNVTQKTIMGENGEETILYLEPRYHPGEEITVVLDALSYTGNSYTFRLHSYDGFLWFRRRGVNKEKFNTETLRPGDCVVAKILYTSEDPKWQRDGSLQRLGIVKAIPLRRVESLTVADLDRTAAKVPA